MFYENKKSLIQVVHKNLHKLGSFFVFLVLVKHPLVKYVFLDFINYLINNWWVKLLRIQIN
jgi:hypothetical protein